MTILDIIRELCKERKITVTALEEELKFGRGSIYKMETSSPSADKLIKLADYFNTSIDYLVGRSNNRNGIALEEVGLTRDTILKLYREYSEKLTVDDKVKLAQDILSDIGRYANM